MNDIAKAVGVANAALYWYFPTKDVLLAEVWNRALDREIEQLSSGPAGTDPFDLLQKGLVDLRPYRQLHMSMHELLLDSDVVAAAHDRLIDWVRGLAREGLAFHSYEDSGTEDITDLVVVLFEGLNVPGIRARTASEIVRVLLDKVVDVD
jgi:AcrR family transcriptional regulator